MVTDGFTTQGDLTVSGTFIAEGSGFFSSGVNITGTLSGTTVTGTNAQFTNVTGVNVIGTTQVSGATVTGGLAKFTTLTGGTAGFTTVTGTTVTGSTGNFTSINAITANFTTGVIREELTVTGDADVKGTFIAEGSGFFSSGVHITGEVSGVTFTGTAAGFTTVTGTTVTGTTVNAVTGVYTTLLSGNLAHPHHHHRWYCRSHHFTGATVTGTNANCYRVLGTFRQCSYNYWQPYRFRDLDVDGALPLRQA